MSENMELNIDLNILEVEPAGEYHAKADRFLSSHQLLDFIKCPWLHRKKALGLIEDKDSPAYLVGRAAHVRILEGRDVYETAFALGGPINPKTNKPFGANTKAFSHWAEVQGKPVLSQAQVDLVEQMASGVSMNNEAIDLLLYGRAEGVMRAEYCGGPCQIRIDWVHPHRGIVDFKTCDDLTWFEADARRYGYHRQMAFYRAVLALAAEPMPFDLPVPPARNDDAATDWQEATDRCRKQTEAKTFRAAAAEGVTTLNRSTLEFIRTGAPAGDRHRLLFSAAANLAELSCPPALAHALLTEAGLDSELSPSETKRQIECGLAHSGGGRYAG